MVDIVEVIEKYWLEFLLGIIGTALITNAKRIKAKVMEYIEMKRKEKKENFKKELMETIQPMLDTVANHSDINDSGLNITLGTLQEHLSMLTEQLNKVTNGVLNMQGNIFKTECKELLKSDTISQEQYDKCMNDHKVYNDLGGNSDGDRYFELVTEKYKHQL